MTDEGESPSTEDPGGLRHSWRKRLEKFKAPVAPEPSPESGSDPIPDTPPVAPPGLTVRRRLSAPTTPEAPVEQPPTESSSRFGRWRANLRYALGQGPGEDETSEDLTNQTIGKWRQKLQAAQVVQPVEAAVEPELPSNPGSWRDRLRFVKPTEEVQPPAVLPSEEVQSSALVADTTSEPEVIQPAVVTSSFEPTALQQPVVASQVDEQAQPPGTISIALGVPFSESVSQAPETELAQESLAGIQLDSPTGPVAVPLGLGIPVEPRVEEPVTEPAPEALGAPHSDTSQLSLSENAAAPADLFSFLAQTVPETESDGPPVEPAPSLGAPLPQVDQSGIDSSAISKSDLPLGSDAPIPPTRPVLGGSLPKPPPQPPSSPPTLKTAAARLKVQKSVRPPLELPAPDALVPEPVAAPSVKPVEAALVSKDWEKVGGKSAVQAVEAFAFQTETVPIDPPVQKVSKLSAITAAPAFKPLDDVAPRLSSGVRPVKGMGAPAKAVTKPAKPRPHYYKVDSQELAVFTRQLSTMIQSGITIHAALSFFGESGQTGQLPIVIEEIANKVCTGSRLSEGFRAFPEVFSPVYVGLVETAEASSRLDETLARLADLLENQNRLRQRLVSAITYPAFLMVASTAAIALFVYYILPMMGSLYQGLGIVLPWPTRVLLQMRTVLPLLVGLLAAGAFGYWLTAQRIQAWLRKKTEVRRKLHRIILNIPVLGVMLEKMSISRVLYSFSTMLDAGLSFSEALRRCAAVAGNQIVSDRLDQSRVDLVDGHSIQECFSRNDVFPRACIQMLAVGEESASMNLMITYAAKYYESEVDCAIERFTALIEPTIMAGMGLFVGFIVLSAVLPTVRLIEAL